MARTTRQELSPRITTKEGTPQLHLSYFGLFFDYASSLLNLPLRYTDNFYYDLGFANLERVLIVLDQLAFKINQIFYEDPKLLSEKSERLLRPMLRYFHIDGSQDCINYLADAIGRSAIVLRSILIEAKKQDIDESWLLGVLDGYLKNKKSTLRRLKFGLKFVPPRLDDFSPKSYLIIYGRAYAYHLDDKELALKNLKFALKAVPQWARFLAKSPLLKYDL